VIDELALTQQTAAALIAASQNPDPAAIGQMQQILVDYSAQLIGMPIDDFNLIIAGSIIKF
jgi:hypothetical protein